MAIATSVLWLVLLIVAVVAAAGVCLQIFLSWRESWWPGLILPGIFFLHSLLLLFNLSASGGAEELALAALGTFCMGNLPTLLFLAPYLICRRRWSRKRQRERMDIQDL